MTLSRWRRKGLRSRGLHWCWWGRVWWGRGGRRWSDQPVLWCVLYIWSDDCNLISLSGNGGDGGDASSGDAFAYSKGGKAKAYSGHGGDASGGSVKDKKPGYGHGYRSGGLIDVASGAYP
jgi:hypothetical protein